MVDPGDVVVQVVQRCEGDPAVPAEVQAGTLVIVGKLHLNCIFCFLKIIVIKLNKYYLPENGYSRCASVRDHTVGTRE